MTAPEETDSPLLLLMRHGKSSWGEKGVDDHDRPLKKRGRRDAARMAEFLQEAGLAPTLICTSTAQRALQTAEIVAAICGCEIVTEPRLYHAPVNVFRSLLPELPPSQRLMVVGHNPGLEELLFRVAEEDVRMPTSAIACLAVRRSALFPTLDSLELKQVWRPKEL